jgi:GH24 family phage-related lysozyme (muramidase)
MSELKRLHGDEAVAAAQQYYKQPMIDPIAEHIIQEEGFVPGIYKDTKNIDTEGVGLTGDNIGKNFFTEVMPIYIDRAMKIDPTFVKLPENTKKALVSMVYRGDIKPSHKTAAYIKAGLYEKAAKEYLNHDDYRASKALNDRAGKRVHGVQYRMEANAEALREAEPKP